MSSRWPVTTISSAAAFHTPALGRVLPLLDTQRVSPSTVRFKASRDVKCRRSTPFDTLRQSQTPDGERQIFKEFGSWSLRNYRKFSGFFHPDNCRFPVRCDGSRIPRCVEVSFHFSEVRDWRRSVLDFPDAMRKKMELKEGHSTLSTRRAANYE